MRWGNNLGLVALNRVLLRLLFPAAAVGMAAFAAGEGWGLLNHFEVLLNATAMFNHGNLRLPARLDRVLRWIVVTPDMHRVHHSIEDDETNSNFGFNLPWWDRLFGTYRDQPRGGHEGMTIGIRGYNTPREVSWLPGLMLLPFRGCVSPWRPHCCGPGAGCRVRSSVLHFVAAGQAARTAGPATRAAMHRSGPSGPPCAPERSRTGSRPGPRTGMRSA
jgi:hypothetical protein